MGKIQKAVVLGQPGCFTVGGIETEALETMSGLQKGQKQPDCH